MKRPPSIPGNFNWREYNYSLVKRGEFLLDLEFVENWDKELLEMNKKKRPGARFEYPNSLIKLQAIWKACGLPLRTIEGTTNQLRKLGELQAKNDHSTIGRRINALDFQFDIPEGELFLFADGTGFQVIEGGEYLREKYGKENRRWTQVVILGDPVTKEPIMVRVNIVQGSEVKTVKEILTEEGLKLKEMAGFGGDGGFDEIELWNTLDFRGIKSAIKPDKNATEHSKSALRNCKVSIRNRAGHGVWAYSVGYGRRWPATEGIFSAVKRMFGEQLHARSEAGIVTEALLKFWAYQKMKRFGEN